MSQLHVTALLALSALALPTATAFAQVPGRGMEGRVTERADIYHCVAAPGGSRMRPNCETETITATFQTEYELKILLEPPAQPAQCGATTTTRYQQRNTIARVDGTLEIKDCTAASGAFTVALSTRDDSGEDKPLEFTETWQRSDDQDVEFTADYPIGENVELLSVRLRGLTCTCADAATDDIEVRELAETPEHPLTEN